MRREFTTDVTGELRGLRSDFSLLKDRLVQIGLCLVGLLLIARVRRRRRARIF
jgi:hypothetical protein